MLNSGLLIYIGWISLKKHYWKLLQHIKNENADLVAYVMRNKMLKTRVMTAVIGFIIALGGHYIRRICV